MINIQKVPPMQFKICSVVLCMLLTAAHIYMFIDSNYMIEPLLRVIFYPTLAITIIFKGKRIIPYMIIGFSIILVQWCSFENYSYIMAICICLVVVPKIKIPVLSLYVVDVVIVCMRHAKSSLHLIIHLGICSVIVLAFEIVNYIKFKAVILDLTEDEDKMLYELAVKRRTQSSIEGYSQSGVQKKLNKMCKRNNCTNNEELYAKYRMQLVHRKCVNSTPNLSDDMKIAE